MESTKINANAICAETRMYVKVSRKLLGTCTARLVLEMLMERKLAMGNSYLPEDKHDAGDEDDDGKIYGGEFGEEDRGICSVCGEWNCEEHKESYTPLKSHPMSHLSPALQEKLKDVWTKLPKKVIEMGDKDLQAIADALDTGEEFMINTGDPTKFKKIELTADEIEEMKKHMGEAEKEEAEEENEDWELPPVETAAGSGVSAKPKGLLLSGGTIVYADMADENDKATVKGPTDWLERIQQDLTNSAVSGAPRTLDIFRPKPNGARVLAIREKAMELVPRLRRQLQLAFEAEARVARARQQKSGAVDAGQVARLVTDGKDDVFAKKAFKKTITSAITIVVDDSSSMKESPGRGFYVGLTGGAAVGKDLLYSKNGCSAVLAYALGEVCNTMQIPFEVIGYQAGSYFAHNHYAIIYKSFNEVWSATRDRIGNYRCDAGTDLPYDAAMFAARRLLARKEDRRMLFMLTDANECNHGISKLGEFAKELKRKANITMIGVSILTDTFAEYLGDKAISVMKLEDLTDAVFTKIARIINPH